MQADLIRRARWFVALLFVVLVEPTRCGMPVAISQGAEIAQATVITEGKTAQGFPYLLGGVSSNEREAMETRAKDFNVALVFAEKSGSYLSDIQLALTSVKVGDILTVTVNGPWFYIQLPPGVYEVKATFKGQTKLMKNLRVMKDNLVKQTFIWDLGEKPEP